MEKIKVKDLVVRPITAKTAISFIKKWHYSGGVMMSSWLHLGVFHGEKLGGVMSFGTPINKKGSIKMVRDTKWQGMIELSRMAFADWLPRNSESRSLAVAMRLIKKNYPAIEWVLSFSDACQCGDGTIYRASGFYLIRIKKNNSQYMVDGIGVMAKKTMTDASYLASNKPQLKDLIAEGKARPMEGFQLTYLMPLNDTVLDRLVTPPIPYSSIADAGAGMYKGKPSRRDKHRSDASSDHDE